MLDPLIQVRMSPPDSRSPEPHAPREAQRPRDDVRMTVPPDDDDGPPLTLAPLDPETEAARQRIREAEQLPAWPAEEVPAPPRWQFSLGQLLLGNTLLCIVLALCQLLMPSLMAGAFGLVALALLVFVNVYQPDRPQAYTVAWGLIFVYLVVALIALAGG